MTREMFTKPEIIGQVDPELFAAIREYMPRGREMLLGRAEILPEALRPLTELLLSRSIIPPKTINYEIDVRDIPPGRTQRGHLWHVDNGDVRSAVVADALPTEFLVPLNGMAWSGPQARRRRNTFLRPPYGLIPDMLDQELADMGLQVWRADPGDVVLMKNQVHRSTKNNQERVIPRTWLRAVIIPLWRAG